MQDVYGEALRLLEQGQSFVLATVIHTKGSTPQKPGAKLLVRSDGSGVGTLGGGCVEGDIWFAARELLRQGGDTLVRDYFLNEDLAARDGLVCGGTMYFLIDPVRQPASLLPYMREIVEAYHGGRPVALATLTKAGNSAGRVGAKLFLREDSSREGTLGDPELDRLAAQEAQSLMAHGKTAYLAAADGAELFLEAYTTPPQLVLMGGGHIAKVIAPVAATLGFRIWVIDDRPQFANRERFPQAVETIVDGFVEGLARVPVNANTFIVIATRGHRFDDLATEAAIRSPASYVGLVGSKRKTILIFEQLLKRGVPLERIKAVRAPVGLDIGGRTPEEIAISILAEILMFRLGGTGAPMKLAEARVDKLYQKVRAASAAVTA